MMTVKEKINKIIISDKRNENRKKQKE